MQKFSFDVIAAVAITVEAPSETEARRMLATLECCEANLGAWPNGDPILCEATLITEDNGAQLFAVDDVDV